jgi:hypothetical protein
MDHTVRVEIIYAVRDTDQLKGEGLRECVGITQEETHKEDPIFVWVQINVSG